jgi:hypothetical protein
MMLMAGCASTYTVGQKESGADYDLEELNRRIEKQDCTLVLTTGEERKVTEVVCAMDSVSWMAPVRISTTRSQISQVQRTSGRSDAVVTFTNGQVTVAEGVIVTNDSVSWMGLARLMVPIRDISAILSRNHPLGLLEGGGLGVLAGVGGGLMVVGVLGASSHDNLAQGWAILAFTVIGGGVGLVTGIIVGGVHGHTYEYKFPQEAKKP